MALIFTIQLNLLHHLKKKSDSLRYVDARQIANILCVSRELWLSSLSYYFSWQVPFFIRGNSVFSGSRVFHVRDNVIRLNSVSFFFGLSGSNRFRVDGEYVRLWSSSSPAVGFLRAWRVLCARTPLRVSTKKYCRDITIVSRGRETSDDHKSRTKDDGLPLKHCRDEARCISSLKKNLYAILARNT